MMHPDRNRGMAPRVFFFASVVAIGFVAGPARSAGAQAQAVRVPFMRVMSAGGLEVVASDQTSGQITLTVRPDRRRARQPEVSIRAIRGTKEELMRLLTDTQQEDDTCVLIQQARIFPATLKRNSLSMHGTVRTNWLVRDDAATRFLNTPYTLVIEEGAVRSDGAAALRIRRVDLQSYLARGLEVIIIPAKNATPGAPGAPSAGEPLTVSYLKRVPCKGYLGPTTAEHITPARFALGAQGPAAKPEAAGSTRLDDVAC